MRGSRVGARDCGGDYAWVFDNPIDTLAARLAGRLVIGFDVTEFLDHALTRAPITMYLFHLVRQLLDGRRLVCWMDEFWRLLADPAFESFAKDGPKTWRKLNGVMCLATQSASDVLDSPISRTLVEQTPTKIFFPNRRCDLHEYTEGFGLTEREFRLIKEQLEPGSRMFLVKQAHHSVVCQLDLKGFDAELAVISGRAGESRRCTGSWQRRDGPLRMTGCRRSWPRTPLVDERTCFIDGFNKRRSSCSSISIVLCWRGSRSWPRQRRLRARNGR